MNLNHRFLMDVSCPACGASGNIRVIEEAGPPFTETPRRAYAAETAAFQITLPSITCVACRTAFPIGS